MPTDDILAVPFITTDQMREVDRLMIEEYGIALVQMMENAGRNLAHLARARFLDGDAWGSRVLVLSGNGGNGGGGLVCARHLHNMGAAVRVYLSTPPSQLADVPRLQYDILERIGVSIEVAQPDAGRQMADLVVDALIGYSLRGAPRGVAASLVRGANAQASPVIALDVPSGLDTTSGAAHEPTMQATATMTLALPKVGLRSEGAKAHVGELYLADISVPPSYTPALR